MTSSRGEWMQLYSGKAFYPLDPRPDEIFPEDIGRALSMICRYGGHTKRFYSVAEHCVALSHYVSAENALKALLHDATEAYVGDMVRPLKRMIPEYSKIEDHLMDVIFYKFGLEPGLPEEVKDADNRILLDERAVMLSEPPQPWHQDLEGLKPLGVQIDGWTPARAFHEYNNRLTALLRSINV